MSRKGMPLLEDFSAAVAGIHDAGVDVASWPAALERVGGLFGSQGATVWMQDPAGGLRDVCFNHQIAEMTQAYAAYYGRFDALRLASERAPAGTVLTNAMVVPASEFVRTEFYADFAQRHDAHDGMEAHIFAGSGCSGYVGVARSSRAGAFGREDVRLLALLLPHLRRAMRTQLRLASLGVERASALKALDGLRPGVLVVDARARVVHANGAAEALLRKGDGLGVEPASQRLRAATPGQMGALRCLIAQAVGGSNGALRLDRAGGAPLLICAAPLRAEAAWNVSPRPAALLLVGAPGDETRSSPSCLRALYGLTPAEAAVAARIARGQGVKDAAEALGIAPSTLRWHLQRVFGKTGTVRQAELARLVERLGTVAGNGHGWHAPKSGIP